MQRRTFGLDEIRVIGKSFPLGGAIEQAAPHGNGHINDTYRVVVGTNRGIVPFIFQRINTSIFHDVDGLMENISRVTAHIRRKLEALDAPDLDRAVLRVIHTSDGAPFLRTPAGDCWRVYNFITDAITVDLATSPVQAYEAAKAFARFQGLLADIPAPPLHETIPHFHSTPHRYWTLRAAIAEDRFQRAAECAPEIEYVESVTDRFDAITRRLSSGSLPTRVTHNDTKLNNVMLDERTGLAVCVIDLDTVMNGSVLYDFGDQVRSAAGRFRENHPDASAVGIDLVYFEHIVRGFIEGARDFLTPEEAGLLWLSGFLITITIGIRFLTDYLQGDVYFKTSRPGENLARCRNQFALARSIEQNRCAMEDIVDKHWGRSS